MVKICSRVSNGKALPSILEIAQEFWLWYKCSLQVLGHHPLRESRPALQVARDAICVSQEGGNLLLSGTVIMRAIFELHDRFIRFEFLFGQRWILGLLYVFLRKIGPTAQQEKKFTSRATASVSVKEGLFRPFFTNNFLDPGLQWWLLFVGIREYNSAVKKTVRYFQTTSCNQTASP